MTRRVLAVAITVLSLSAAAGRPAYAADASDLRQTLDGSLAKVAFYFRYDRGESPGRESSGGCAALWRLAGQLGARSSGYDVDRRQPLVTGGFVIATDTVLVEDPAIEDRFIDRIEVTIRNTTYGASIDAMAVENKALFLKLSSRVAGARPIAFDSKASPPYSAVTYAQGSDGVWGIQLTPLGGDATVTDNGGRPVHVPSPALIVNSRGRIAGAAFTGVISEGSRWKGTPFLWKRVTAADFGAASARALETSATGIAHVTVKFRIKQSRRWDDSSYWEQRETPTEKDVPGLILEGGKVLLMTDLTRRQTANIDSAVLVLPGGNVPLAIEGGLVDYAALVARYDGQHEGARPIPVQDADFSRSVDRLLMADRISYSSGARDEHVMRGRITGIYHGPLGAMWPQSDPAGAYLFGLDGKLVAVPLGLRRQVAMGEYYYGEDEYGYGNQLLMPATVLAAVAKDPSALDASWLPMSEDDARRFAWIGIETQDLTKDLARAKNASVLTKGGEIGVLVSHVYKASPSEKAGVKSGDVLVRFLIDGQVKPVDVKMRDQSDSDFPWSELDQVSDAYFEQLPRPWPTQNNALAKTLTEVGIGRSIKAEFVRDGQVRMVDFVLEYGPPDFNSAASFEDKASGLTVKDVTYEVRRYFKMKGDDPGVVVSDIKKGSKASVGGVKPCEIVTAVNGKSAANTDDFKNAISAGGEVSLTVKRMSQTRVVKLKLPVASAQKETTAQPQPSATTETTSPASQDAPESDGSESDAAANAEQAQPAQ